MQIHFVDSIHETTFNRFKERYGFKDGDRDRTILFYLIAALEDLTGDRLADVIEDKPDGGFQLRRDALHHDWLTSGDRKIIRLAFHCYSWDIATVPADAPTRTRNREMENYMPINLFTGLDSRLGEAAREAIRLLMVM